MSSFREAAGLSHSPSTFNLLYLSTVLLLAFAKQEEQQTTLIKYSLVDLRDPTYKIVVGGRGKWMNLQHWYSKVDRYVCTM